jgi:hypothetical protein
MANRLSKEKANAIASEYMTNGLRKVDALLGVGYSKSYANKVGLKLYDNDLVKQAIAKIEAANNANTTYTIEQYQLELDTALALATKLNQPSACVSAIVAKGRSMGFDKDNDVSDTKSAEIDANQKVEAHRLAQIRLTS